MTKVVFIKFTFFLSYRHWFVFSDILSFLSAATCLLAFVSGDVYENSSNDIIIGGMNGAVNFSRPEGERMFYFCSIQLYTKQKLNMAVERVAIATDRVYAMGWSNDGQIDYVHFHGTLDIVVLWVDGHDTRERPPLVFEDFSRWVTRNGCDNVQMQIYNDGKNFMNIRWN
jgi:hypothetical protein